MILTARQRQHLKGLGHRLNPVLQVGGGGLSQAFLDELELALLAHELVKVKIGASDGAGRKRDAAELAEKSGATLAQVIGRMVLLYRPHPDKPRLVLPTRSKAREAKTAAAKARKAKEKR